MQELSLENLEQISGGTISDSSTWGASADLALNFLTGIFGRSTFLASINAETYLKYRCIPGSPCFS